MKIFFAKAFRLLGWLRFDFHVERHSELPGHDLIDPGTMILVESGEIQKWACMSCPGGCGQNISLSLNPEQRPRWAISADFWQRPTVHPSVHQKNSCGCHFWLKKGHVHWCKGGRPRPKTHEIR